MLSQIAEFPSFLWLNNIPFVCVYHIFFIYLSIDRHLDCVYVLTIVDNDAANLEVQTLLNIMSEPLTVFGSLREVE